MIDLPTKFEVPSFTRYRDTKGAENAQNGVFGLVRGDPGSSAMSLIDIVHTIPV